MCKVENFVPTTGIPKEESQATEQSKYLKIQLRNVPEIKEI